MPMKNPFIYGKRVSGQAFFDRVKVKADILHVLDGGSNVLLYGPRRYGKSSLVGEILTDIRSGGGNCAELNMMDVASLEDFIARYARVIYRELAPVSGALNLVAGILKRMSPAIGLDNEGRPELRIAISSGKCTVEDLREVLMLPEHLCGGERKITIAIDEFQEVCDLGLGSQFERTMRSVIERQEHVSYIFLGSKTHILERMFSSRSRPFYNSVQKFMLNRPPADESADFLIDRFNSVSIVLDRQLAVKMVEMVDNVPYYLQALGSWTLNSVRGRDAAEVLQEDVCDGFDSMYAAECIQLESVFRAHSESQRMLMRALALESTNRFDEAYRARHGLKSTSTVNTALRRLIAESTVEQSEAGYRLGDPLLTHYLTKGE